MLEKRDVRRFGYGISSDKVSVSGSVLSDLHFGDISLLELSALVKEGRVVAHDVVNRDAGGEGDTTLDVLALLAVVRLSDFVLDHGVDRVAHCRDVGSRNAELRCLCQAR